MTTHAINKIEATRKLEAYPAAYGRLDVALTIFLGKNLLGKTLLIGRLLFNCLISRYVKSREYTYDTVVVNSLTRRKHLRTVDNFIQKPYCYVTDDILDFMFYKRRGYAVRLARSGVPIVKLSWLIIRNFRSITDIYINLLDISQQSLYHTNVTGESVQVVSLCDTHFFESIVVMKARAEGKNTISLQHGEISTVWFPCLSDRFITYNQRSKEIANRISGCEAMKVSVDRMTFTDGSLCPLSECGCVLVAHSVHTPTVSRQLISTALMLGGAGYRVIFKARPKSSLMDQLYLQWCFLGSNIELVTSDSISDILTRTIVILSCGSGVIRDGGFLGIPGYDLQYLDDTESRLSVCDGAIIRSEEKLIEMLKRREFSDPAVRTAAFNGWASF